MIDFLILILILIPVSLGIRSIVRVFCGKERCECIGDCSRCRIQCTSNELYYVIQKRK